MIVTIDFSFNWGFLLGIGQLHQEPNKLVIALGLVVITINWKRKSDND